MPKSKKNQLPVLVWPDGRIPAAIYCRVSSRGQDVENSIDAQRARIEEWAEKNGYVIVVIFADEAKTGRNSNRPDFQELLEVVDKGGCPFQVVLVWRFSRFYRNDEESAFYKRYLKKKGIKVHSINETVDDSAAGKFAERVFEAHDAFQSDLISEDVKRGSHRLAERGFFMGAKPPFGMMKIKVTDGKKVRNKLAPNPETAPRMRRLFDLLLEDKTNSQVSAGLNAEGIANASGRKWTPKRIHDAANNLHYEGTIVWGLSSETDDPVITPGAHEGIITPEEGAKIRELRAARAPNVANPRHAGSDHLLSGLVKCRQCGAEYTYAPGGQKANTGKIYHYMVCNTRKEKTEQCHDSPRLPAEEFEAASLKFILDDILTDSTAEYMVSVLHAESGDEHNRVMSELERLDKQVADIEMRQYQAYLAFEGGQLKYEWYCERNQELTEMKEAAQTKRSNILESADNRIVVLENPAATIRYISELGKFLREEEPSRCRSWLKSFVKWIWVEPGQGTVELRIPTPMDSPSPGISRLRFDLKDTVRPSTRAAPAQRTQS